MTSGYVYQYKYMGDINLSDTSIYFFPGERMTKWWNVKVFSFYLAKPFLSKAKTAHRKFLENVIDGLVVKLWTQ